MESKVNYTVIGLVVLVLVASLLGAALWLSIGFDRKTYDIYTIYVGEAVSGLSDDSIVKFNGVKVGVVDTIELNPFDPQQVKINIKIEEGIPITNSTHATLINQGITGTTYLGLSATSPSLLPLQKTPGETYPVIPYQPSFLSELETNLHQVSVGFKRVFDKENASSIKKTLANLQTITDVMAKNNNNFHESFQKLPLLINDLKKAVGQFNEMSLNMSEAGKQVTLTMKSGKNTIDKISQQTIPPITILLDRLNVIAANLEQMSTQMRQNPAVIIRGTAPPKPGPGE